MSDAGYLTAGKYAESEIVINKSRFLGYVFPVGTKQEADDRIAEIRAKHPQARHAVFAYRVRENSYSRYSDDGEPSGTAGMPVLDVIAKQDITDCLIVVVRYFGGVLLGTGGLVRAYTSAAKEALENAGTVNMRLCSVLSISCDYSLYGKISALIPTFGGTVESTSFGTETGIEFTLPSENEDAFGKKLNGLSNGKISPVKIKEKFSAL